MLIQLCKVKQLLKQKEVDDFMHFKTCLTPKIPCIFFSLKSISKKIKV
jgi:predicted metal-binding protein